MESTEAPVLIVGAGPVGMTAALLLERMGVRAMVVERRTHTQRAPAAHVVNARTFEICRQAGVDMNAVAAAAKSPADAGFTYWVTKLGGEVLGKLPFERQDDDVLAVTPTPLRNLSQHRFEPILLDALRTAGAAPVRFGHRWDACEQDADGVTSLVTELSTAKVFQVRSRFVVAADGAGSPVRKSAGIAMNGPERLQSFVMIHFEASLRSLVGDALGVLYWVNDPECRGIFVAHDLDREWVFMHAFDSERESPISYDTARCEAIVRRAIARDDVELSVRTVSTWVMTSQVADTYRCGRVLLAGDAAHRFPPTGGMGLNTGMQDAHNLAWKLAAVLEGKAPDSLLDTYEVERRPVAVFNAEQSLANAMRMFEVPAALGFDENLDVAKRAYAAALADKSKRAEVSAAIANQAEHFDMLGLQLGYAYDEGALLPDGSPRPIVANPVRELAVSSRPGARLPHGWVVRDGERISTLDLIELARPTLLVGPEGEVWLDAARTIDAQLACVRIGVDVADPGRWWAVCAGMGAAGALLVRPDQHVAFRAAAAPAAPRAELERAIAASYGCDVRPIA